jgi:hypothetical protein
LRQRRTFDEPDTCVEFAHGVVRAEFSPERIYGLIYY